MTFAQKSYDFQKKLWLSLKKSYDSKKVMTFAQKSYDFQKKLWLSLNHR